MISITQGSSLADNGGMIIVSPSGQYADTDLILCATKTEPDLAIAMYQAQFLRYGDIVYQFNTPEDLGKAVFAIDPEATLDAVTLYKEQLARDTARLAGTLEPSNPVPTPDAVPEEVSTEVPTDEEVIVPESIPEDVPETSSLLESSEDLSNITAGTSTADVSTTTPAASDSGVASSTESAAQ